MSKKKYSAEELKRKIRHADLFGYQVAAAAGISVPTLQIWYRDLTEERADKILSAIEKLSKQGAAS